LKKADPAKTDLYVGMKAQKSELLQKDLKPYQSLLFATHGYFGKDLPGIQEPVLILTLVDQPKDQNGFLRLSEVMGLKLNCDVAALTACQTGLGRVISGEGTMGMGRAFQYAGAKSVIMSLWSVSETASVNLVESFFGHLKEGKNKLEALRLARDEIRKAGYDHPFYWAPFILVGEVGDASIVHTSGTTRPGLVVGPEPRADVPATRQDQSEQFYSVVFNETDGAISVKVTRGNEMIATRNISWNKSEVDRKVRIFLEPLQNVGILNDSLKAFQTDVGKALYAELLSPVLDKVPRGVNLIIAPHLPALAALPFEALVVEGTPRLEESEGRTRVSGLTYLGDLYQIGYARPAWLGQASTRCPPPRDKGERILVLADPVFEPDDPRVAEEGKRKRQRLLDLTPEKLMGEHADGIVLSRLARTGSFADSLRTLFPDQADVRTGLAASKKTLTETDLCQYSTIVVATQGYFGDAFVGIKEPMLMLSRLDQSGISTDRILRASEVSRLRVRSALVVLLACQTGVGPVLPGGGVASMGNAFLEAGAGSVLVSLWPLMENSSVMLVENFFKHIKEGKSKLEALRLARDELRKAGYDHPFYWSPFILVGDVD
jgi:CHAT domain-containing protein